MNVVQNLGNVDEASVNSEDLPAAPERFMVVNSLKSKLPPTLIIKSTKLRVLDPIGQGYSVEILLALLCNL